MRKFPGYLKKILSLFSLVFVFSSIFATLSSPAFAATTLTSSKKMTYILNSNGTLQATYAITLYNPGKVAAVVTSYKLPIPFTNFQNAALYVGSREYQYTVQTTSTRSDIYIALNNEVISPKSSKTISFEFQIPKYMNTTKSLYEVELPGKTSDIEKNMVEIIYPASWPDPIRISEPYTLKKSTVKTLYIDDIKNESIDLLLGEKVVYEYTIKKLLVNEYDNEKLFEINIPRISSKQKVLIDNIDPQPESIYTDRSDNTNFLYRIPAGDSKNILIHGYIYVGESTNVELKDASELIKNGGYWLISDNQEKNRLTVYLNQRQIPTKLSDAKTQEQRLALYKSIYTYVLDRLDPLKKSELENYSSRRGFDNILKDRTNSSADDYVDFTISLMRFCEVPTRMVLGYIADTSTKKGYYHTWVEYWDMDSGNWITIDPYLAEIRQNDYWGKEFKDRVIFVVRDYDSVKPQLQYLSSDELSIKISSSIVSEYTNIETTIVDGSSTIFSKYLSSQITVKNTGNTLVSIKDIKLLNNQEKEISNYAISGDTVVQPGVSISIPLLVSNKKENQDIKAVINYADYNGHSDQVVKSISHKVTTPLYWTIGVYSFIFIVILCIILIISKLFRKK